MTLRFRKWPLENLWIASQHRIVVWPEINSYRIDRRHEDGRFALFVPGVERRSGAQHFDTLEEAKAAAEKDSHA
jgi:hypothetical protein